MGNPINEITKGLKAVETFQNIMLKPQTLEAFDRMSASVERLSGQLTSLNSTMLEQNKQLGESIRETKQQTIELREELEKLNDVNSKSHGIFEEMKKASETTERLTRVIATFTILAMAFGSYPVYKDVACGTSTSCDYQLIAILSIGSALILVLMLVWILKGKKQEKKEAEHAESAREK